MRSREKSIFLLSVFAILISLLLRTLIPTISYNRVTGRFLLSDYHTSLDAFMILSALISIIAASSILLRQKTIYEPKPEFYSLLSEIGDTFEKYTKKDGSKNYDKILYRILPSIRKIIKNYSHILRELPSDLRSPFFEVYYSIYGKHGHYNEGRKIYELRHLEEAVKELLKKRYNLH